MTSDLESNSTTCGTTFSPPWGSTLFGLGPSIGATFRDDEGPAARGNPVPSRESVRSNPH